MYYRPLQTSQEEMDSKNSFELHTWMIARFIETSRSGSPPDRSLSHYVIAACYEKMITRMEYRVSKSFRDTLKPDNLAKNFEFPGQIPPIKGSKSNDGHFIDFLCKCNTLKLNTPIDNLVHHRKDLYNKETYADFHSILSELLELFFKSLVELKNIHHGLVKETPSSEELIIIKAAIDSIAVVGTVLRLLVKSQAIKRCLHSIAKLLPDRAAGVKVDDDEKDGDDDKRVGDEDEWEMGEEENGLYRDHEGEDGLEGDDESDAVDLEEGSTITGKSQACLKSLNLVVVYIDAILVLSKFVKAQKLESDFFKINIKILLLPCHRKNDESMLSWKTLLQHEKYFPGKPSPSAKHIVDFLEVLSGARSQRSDQITTVDQKSSKKVQKSKRNPVLTESSPEFVLWMLEDLRRDAVGSKNDIFHVKIGKVASAMLTLQYTLVGSAKYINLINNKLSLLATEGVYDDDDLEKMKEIDGIMNMLRTLADNTKLERMLQKGSALDTGIGFKGSLHCEACIAAHCTFKDSKWFPPVSYFIIMLCSDLLILLVVCYTSTRCI
jgi:hypothetical protein